MDIKIDKQQDVRDIVVRITGEIDAFTAPKLRKELLSLTEEQNETIIINLKDVAYLDSTGLGVFVSLFKQVKKNGGVIQLIELSDRVKRLFEITGLSHVMNISAIKDGRR